MDASEAAQARTEIWKYHDEEDREGCAEAGSKLLEELSDESSEEFNGEYIRRAFWLADEAEKYQREGDEELEDYFYKKAGELLEAAWRSAGLPTEQLEHRIGWWKAYRHGDMSKAKNDMYNEHLTMSGDEEVAREATGKLAEATREHGENNWSEVERKLTEYHGIIDF